MVSVNYGEPRAPMSSILLKDQYFDNEIDFCRTCNYHVLELIERKFLFHGISYFVKPEDNSVLARLFGTSADRNIVRINAKDYDLAFDLADGIRGVEILAEEPERDWCPKEFLSRRRSEGHPAGRGRDRYYDDELYAQ